MNILDEIVLHTRETLRQRKEQIPLDELIARCVYARREPRFKAALSAHGGPHLIAEIKKSSPSSGVIRADFDPVAIARGYEKAGAACLSVLTEEKYFGGSLGIFDEVRKAVSLPILRKDFIVDEYQIYESRVHGADAILLIASLLDGDALRRFGALALKLGLDVLLEIHEAGEIDAVGLVPEAVVGINVRDLKNFSVDLGVLPALLGALPRKRVVICESGVKDSGDLALVKETRVAGVLVGTTLMRAKDPGGLARQFSDFLKQ